MSSILYCTQPFPLYISHSEIPNPCPTSRLPCMPYNPLLLDTPFIIFFHFTSQIVTLYLCSLSLSLYSLPFSSSRSLFTLPCFPFPTTLSCLNHPPVPPSPSLDALASLTLLKYSTRAVCWRDVRANQIGDRTGCGGCCSNAAQATVLLQQHNTDYSAAAAVQYRLPCCSSSSVQATVLLQQCNTGYRAASSCCDVSVAAYFNSE